MFLPSFSFMHKDIHLNDMRKSHCSVTCLFSRGTSIVWTKDCNNDSLMLFAVLCLLKPSPHMTSMCCLYPQLAPQETH